MIFENIPSEVKRNIAIGAGVFVAATAAVLIRQHYENKRIDQAVGEMSESLKHWAREYYAQQQGANKDNNK